MRKTDGSNTENAALLWCREGRRAMQVGDATRGAEAVTASGNNIESSIVRVMDIDMDRYIRRPLIIGDCPLFMQLLMSILRDCLLAKAQQDYAFASA